MMDYETAKKILDNYPTEDDFINENVAMVFKNGTVDDNSLDLAALYQEAGKVMRSEIELENCDF